MAILLISSHKTSAINGRTNGVVALRTAPGLVLKLLKLLRTLLEPTRQA